uniref:Uncharacterized protein n=1 Tax=Rhizobium meliloti TaxID=382 RepID=I2E291_RHIML|nr:short hypothetical protein [Sinorhizobium meliloti]
MGIVARRASCHAAHRYRGGSGDQSGPGGLTFMAFPAGVLAGMSAAWTAVATHSARTGRMVSSAG